MRTLQRFAKEIMMHSVGGGRMSMALFVGNGLLHERYGMRKIVGRTAFCSVAQGNCVLDIEQTFLLLCLHFLISYYCLKTTKFKPKRQP